MVLELRCRRCGKQRTFLPVDLLKICNPMHPVHLPPFECGRCGTAEFVSVRTRVPLPEEYGRLSIRRPVGQVWKWRTSLLGD